MIIVSGNKKSFLTLLTVSLLVGCALRPSRAASNYRLW